MTSGPYMMARSGRRFYFAAPDPEAIDLGDIVFALRYLHRYTGHVGRYDVGVHSVNVLACARELGADHATQRAALMHDAHEAFVGDVSSPLKAAMRAELGMDVACPYDEIEDRAALAVRRRFKIEGFDEALVAKADRMVTHAEALHFLGEPARAWAADPWTGLRYEMHPERFAWACQDWGIV